MRRYITKPYSRIDNTILFVLNIAFLLNCGILCSTYIDIWWLNMIIGFVEGVIVTLTTSILYWNRYSEIKHLVRLQSRTFKYLYTPYEGLDEAKVLKLLKDICNATNVPIEERKPLFDEVSNFYVDYFHDHIIPASVSLMWKKAVVEYKKWEIWND